MYQYNYNKKFDFLKYIDYKKTKLLKLFFNKLPSKLTMSKNKSTLKKGKLLKNIDKNKENLFSNEYLYFNKYTFNFFILDVDHKNYKINDFINILNDNFIAPPNWIVETKNGYQLGFILEKPFNLYEKKLSEKDKQLKKYTLYLQKKMLFLLGGDFNACRLQGFWKNPLGMNLKKYKCYVNDKNFFNLSDFDIYLPGFEKYEFNKNKKGNLNGDFHHDKEKIKYYINELYKGNLDILKKVKIGYRNSFLWYLGMILIKHEKEDWENKLHFYNNNLPQPLKGNEMENIKSSIIKYTRNNRNFVGLGSYEMWTKKMKNLYMKNYLKKKGIVKYSNEERKEINKNKVLKTIYKLRKNNEKPSIRKISKLCGLSKNTVNKYVKELKEDPKFKVLFEK